MFVCSGVVPGLSKSQFSTNGKQVTRELRLILLFFILLRYVMVDKIDYLVKVAGFTDRPDPENRDKVTTHYEVVIDHVPSGTMWRVYKRYNAWYNLYEQMKLKDNFRESFAGFQFPVKALLNNTKIKLKRKDVFHNLLKLIFSQRPIPSEIASFLELNNAPELLSSSLLKDMAGVGGTLDILSVEDKRFSQMSQLSALSSELGVSKDISEVDGAIDSVQESSGGDASASAFSQLKESDIFGACLDPTAPKGIIEKSTGLDKIQRADRSLEMGQDDLFLEFSPQNEEQKGVMQFNLANTDNAVVPSEAESEADWLIKNESLLNKNKVAAYLVQECSAKVLKKLSLSCFEVGNFASVVDCLNLFVIRSGACALEIESDILISLLVAFSEAHVELCKDDPDRLISDKWHEVGDLSLCIIELQRTLKSHQESNIDEKEMMLEFTRKLRSMVASPLDPEVVFPSSLIRDIFSRIITLGPPDSENKPRLPSYTFSTVVYSGKLIWEIGRGEEPAIYFTVLTYDCIYCFLREGDSAPVLGIPLRYIRPEAADGLNAKMIQFFPAEESSMLIILYGSGLSASKQSITFKILGGADEFGRWLDQIEECCWDCRIGNKDYASSNQLLTSLMSEPK